MKCEYATLEELPLTMSMLSTSKLNNTRRL